jgi:hypothetical protein
MLIVHPLEKYFANTQLIESFSSSARSSALDAGSHRSQSRPASQADGFVLLSFRDDDSKNIARSFCLCAGSNSEPVQHRRSSARYER